MTNKTTIETLIDTKINARYVTLQKNIANEVEEIAKRYPEIKCDGECVTLFTALWAAIELKKTAILVEYTDQEWKNHGASS